MSWLAPLGWLRGFFDLISNSYRSVRTLGALTTYQKVLFAALILPAPFLEVVGLTLFLPLVALVDGGGNTTSIAEKGGIWRMVALFLDITRLPHSVFSLSLLIVIAIVLRQAVQYFRAVFSARVAEDLVIELRNRLISSILAAQFPAVRHLSVGRAADLGMVQVSRCRNVLLRLLELCNLAWTLLVYGMAMLFISPSISLVAVGAMGAGALIVAPTIREVKRLSKEMVRENSDFGAWYVQTLTRLRVIKLFGAEKKEHAESDYRSRRLGALSLQNTRAVARLPRQLTIGAVVVGMLGINVTAAGGILESGTLLLFLLMLMRILPILVSFAQIMQGLVSQLASMTKVLDGIKALSDAKEIDGGTKELHCLRHAIRFENVSYIYNGSETFALRDINLIIPAGKITVISGPSGAGKSTLVDLLPRLDRPTSGQILFDDLPIEMFSISSLRRAIGFLDQNPALMNGTVAQNLRYGRAESTNEELLEACRISNAVEFIEKLPEGLDTRIGEGGIGLSGGELQRLALARALVAKTSILILDEPTSAVDSRSETLILNALRDVADRLGVTVVMITHRPVSQGFADQIVHLERGMIVSQHSLQRAPEAAHA